MEKILVSLGLISEMPSRSLALLWTFFHKGEKQNLTHYHTYCKGCVRHHTEDLMAQEPLVTLDDAADLARQNRIFGQGALPSALFDRLVVTDIHLPACINSQSIRGEKTAFVAHILGRVGRGAATSEKCPHTSLEAREEAKAHREELSVSSTSSKRSAPDGEHSSIQSKKSKTGTQQPLRVYNALSMPFSATEAAAIKAQALRAAISGNFPFRAFEDVEVLKLLGMLRKEAPDIMPSRKILSGSLLNEAANVCDRNLSAVLQGKELGLSFVVLFKLPKP
jgi:hypothetical protein